MNRFAASRSDLSFLADSGELGRRILELDWEKHPLGPPETWPQSLKVVIRVMLNSRFAMWMGWGPDFHFFHNDAYAPTLGIKRDRALGAPAPELWAEIWKDIGPRAESVVQTGQATWDESLLLFLERSGFAEETYHTFSYSPIPDDDGSIGGMLCVVTEETERVIGERRLALLQALGADLASTNTENDVFRAIAERFAVRSEDLPFALIYLLAEDGKSVRLACAHHAEPGGSTAPDTIQMGSGPEVWPVSRLFAKNGSVTVDDLAARFSELPFQPWDKPPRSALLVPIAQPGQERPAGFLVAGLNPYRPLDAAYSGFLDLLSGQIAAGLASARAYEAERRRAEALAEIDRAKTAFFSNVSHEFRTPLTLLLGPLEEITGRSDSLPEEDRALLRAAQRNAERLLKLVNSLLEFSRIEAGRVSARFEPTDLASYTAELASSFRSAIERAGLEFVVDCPPLPEQVHVDREMWEKIVLNLLSNAFKFTLHGEICISIRAAADRVEMAVRDTGVGIPDEAKPHLFERFYRVEGAHGRTHEGSGIGLALVNEWVKLHGGVVRVESEHGRGSAFFVTLPTGSSHLPQDQRAPEPSLRAETPAAKAFVAEALRWLPAQAGSVGLSCDQPDGEPPPFPAPRPRILLADDNADMRDYVTRLLSSRFEVVAVTDGEAAFASAAAERPDLVLSDVMMPRLDGFGLLRKMRAHPALQSVPIILLSARAGEEARVEGLDAGADGYLIKPFHARELLAKITGTLALAKVRAEALARLTESAEQLRLIADTAPVLIAHCDRDHRYKFVNEPYASRFNMRRDQVIGRRMPEVIGEAAYESVRSQMERTLAGEPVEFEITIPYEKLGSLHMRCAYAPERAADGEVVGLVAAIVDITDRKRGELRLAEQARLLDLSFDAIFVRDAHDRITYWNKGAEDAYGFTREEALGRVSYELLRTEFPQPLPEIIEQLRRDSRWIGELRHTRKDGTVLFDNTRWALDRDADGNPSSILETNTDVTHRKQSEILLLEQTKLLEVIAKGYPLEDCLTALCMAVSRLSSHCRACVLVTDPARRVFRRSIAPDFPPAFVEALRDAPIGEPPIGTCAAAVLSGQTVTSADIAADERWSQEWRALCCAHGIRACRSAPVRDADGMPLASVALFLDEPREPTEWENRLVEFGAHVASLTLDRDRAGQALREAKEAAEAANQSKDRFLAVLSHELRTPLTPVLMSLAARERDVELPADLREDLAMMKRNIELETKLIDDLLDLNRITTGKLRLQLETVDLNEAVRQVCSICRPQADEKGVSLQCELAPVVGAVAADPARLQQVLWNLVKNAIKFTPQGGCIRITTGSRPGNRSAVEVMDSGIGIPAATLPRIFEAFEQGDPAITRQFGGLGLGLAISRALVELHHGSIRAESEGHGRGAKFIVELPPEQPGATPAAPPPKPKPEALPRLKLLVVEDHPDTARTLRSLLSRSGYAVSVAGDVAGALELARRESFDVLISDLGLPDGSGYDVMAGLRKIQPLPGIAMSGYGMEDDVRRSREAGFHEHLLKPIEVPQLHAAIRRLTERKPPFDGV